MSIDEPNLLYRLLRPFLNLQGANRFSGCIICGDRWNWKKHHRIQGPGGIGMFPYCEECHRKATKEQKLRAINRLYLLWDSQSKGPLDQAHIDLYQYAIRTVEAEQ